MNSPFRSLRYQTFDSTMPSVKVRGLPRHMYAYIRDNPLLCVFAALFLIGMLAGVLLLRNADGQLREVLRMLLGGYVEKRSVQSFTAVAAASFGAMALLLLILFFCGFCTISQPVIIALILFRGMGYGFSIGGLYAEKGISAMQYVFLLLFIPLVLGVLLLICAARTSFLLSVRLFQKAIAPSDRDERYRMQRYCIKYFLYVVLGILIALLDAALTNRFGQIFTF